MCTVSMIMDHYTEQWQPRIPSYPTLPYQPQDPPPITADEIREFRALLDRAREYDKRNGEPECELDSKKKVLKDLAQKLGIDISFIDETS